MIETGRSEYRIESKLTNKHKLSYIKITQTSAMASLLQFKHTNDIFEESNTQSTGAQPLGVNIAIVLEFS